MTKEVKKKEGWGAEEEKGSSLLFFDHIPFSSSARRREGNMVGEYGPRRREGNMVGQKKRREYGRGEEEKGIWSLSSSIGNMVPLFFPSS